MGKYPVLYTSTVTPTEMAALRHIALGACGDGINWRDTVFSIWANKGIDLKTVLDPNDPNYSPETAADNAAKEEILKQIAWHLFVAIISNTRGTVSVSEAVGLIMLGRYVTLYVEDIHAGQVIKDQEISGEEARIINNCRRFLRDISTAVGVTVYTSLEEAAYSVPDDKNQLRNRRFRPLSTNQKLAVKRLIASYGYGRWNSPNCCIEISEDPFDAQLEVIIALASALARESQQESLTIVVPKTSVWEGTVSHGLEITGRRLEDLGRVVSPYLFDQLNNARIGQLYVVQR